MKKLGLAAACAAAIGLSVGFGGAAEAAAPTISMGSAQAVVTLPHGCTANDFRVVNWTDGSYHGYIQASCSGKAELFYVQRNPVGQWALRSTTIDMPHVKAVAVDNTGTYFVGERANGNLVLVRRNNNGSLSAVHALDGGHTPIASVSLAAQNGNYWVVWDHYSQQGSFTDFAVLQATTMSPAVAPTHIDYSKYSPALVMRGSQSPLLYVCRLDGDVPDEYESYLGTMTEQNNKWSGGNQTNLHACGEPVPYGLQGAYFNNHDYVIDYGGGALYSDVSGTLARTGINADTVLRTTATSVDAINGDDVYTQNADGSFLTTPTGTMTAAPVPVYQHQVVNRAGKLIRLFVQKDSAGHPGTRLLQQVQS